MASNAKICYFCEKSESKYVCPKCSKSYCSLDCYKSPKHADCSETFYKDCVLEELRNENCDPEAKKEMVQILKRQYEEAAAPLDSDDDDPECEEEELPLEERLAGLDLDSADPDVLKERLTSDELEEFEKLLRTEEIYTYLPDWKPWWKTKTPLVEEITKKVQDPAIPKRLDAPKLESFLKQPPSPKLKFNLVNILYSYVHTVYFYQGEHLLLPLEAVEVVLTLSNTLDKADNHESIESAIDSCVYAMNEATEMSLKQAEALLLDVAEIVEGSDRKSTDYMQSALSDLYNLFTLARKKLRSSTDDVDKEKRKKYLLVTKKLEFLSSWLTSCGHEMLLLAMVLYDLCKSKLDNLKKHAQLETEVDKMRKSKLVYRNKSLKITELPMEK